MNLEDKMLTDLVDAHTTIDVQKKLISDLRRERDYYKDKGETSFNVAVSWCVTFAIVAAVGVALFYLTELL